MPTRSVTLTEGESEAVESLVESGRYESAEEVIGEALHLLVDHETADDGTKLARLRAEAQIGSDAIARGEYQDFETVDDLIRYLDRLGDDVISGESTSDRSGLECSLRPNSAT